MRLEAEASLAGKTPVDAVVIASDARDVAAKMFFQGWRPGHQLEAEAVIDHGEAAGGEQETLPVGTGDELAAAGTVEGLAGFGRELFAERLQLAATQRVDQVAGEGCALTLPLAEALFDQMVGTALLGVLFVVLVKRWRSRTPGILFPLYVSAYSFVRLLVEPLRIDQAHHWLGVRQNVWVAAGLLVAGLVAAWVMRRRDPARRA